MKNCYYAAFVPGLQELVAQAVRERLPDVSIKKLLEGAIIFETECSYDRLNFFCFNNIFAVIDIVDITEDSAVHREHPENNGKNILEFHAGKILRPGRDLPKGAAGVISENSKKIKTFRLVCSIENKPAALDETLRRKMEKFIEDHSYLKLNRSGPDTEFWLLYRREGISLFLKRLTRSFEKNLQPGELSPPLAWLLCRAAGLRSGDTVLDPFSGYGAIPEAVIKHFPVKKIVALDTENRCVKICRRKKSLQSERAGIHNADFFSFSFSPGSFDAIITDPPWGHYRESQIPQEVFYEKMLAFFSGLLKPEGRAVILAGIELESAAKKTAALKLEKSMPVLVSGKKASVFVFKKP